MNYCRLLQLPLLVSSYLLCLIWGSIFICLFQFTCRLLQGSLCFVNILVVGVLFCKVAGLLSVLPLQ